MFDWVLVYLTLFAVYLKVLFSKIQRYYNPYCPKVERVDDNHLKIDFMIENYKYTVFLKQVALHPDFRKCYIENDQCEDITDEIKSANKFIQVNVTPRLLGYKYITLWNDDDPKIYKLNDLVML